MTRVVGFHGVPAPRRHVARQLRELADIIERDEGSKAFAAGIKRTMCPERYNREQRAEWLAAWDVAQEAAR
jgi:ribosome modulation factor